MSRFFLKAPLTLPTILSFSLSISSSGSGSGSVSANSSGSGNGSGKSRSSINGAAWVRKKIGSEKIW